MSDPPRQLAPPACWDDFLGDRARRDELRSAWSTTLDGLLGDPPASDAFYNPLRTPTGGAGPARVEWTAFPKRVEDRTDLGPAGKLAEADVRDRQAEYCEWCVRRNGAGKVIQVVFTCELVEYWQALWGVSQERVLALYRELVSPAVPLADLKLPGTETYNPRNDWNTGGELRADGGGNVHMVVQSPANTLIAALGVVRGAAASTDDNPQGGADHADEHIRVSVARLVLRQNLRISFSDPIGVYLGEPQFNRFELPLAAPRRARPESYWRVLRGDRQRGWALRAVYEVPAGLGFVVGDIRIDGQPIEHGSQIARALKSGTFVTPIARP